MRAAVCAIALAIGCKGEQATVVANGASVREATVTRGDLSDRVLLTGELRSGSSTDLNVPKTDVWELTIRWMAEDGAAVKAGDRVLEFDNSAFTTGLVQKSIAVIEANSTFRTFKDISAMAIAVKDFELQQHRVALEKTKLLASVPADLLPQRTAQERQLEQMRAEVTVAKAERDLAAERQASALEQRVKQIDLDKAKRSVAAAEQSIGELVLKAPRDGVLSIGTHPWMGQRFQIGDVVQPGFTIVTLPDFSKPMEVMADVSDVDDGRVIPGMKGTCTLDAYPGEPLPCTITELAPVARSKARQSLRRAFAATLALARTDPDRMRPGMSVKVELVRPAVKQALLVPRNAVVLGVGTAGEIDAKLTKVRMASGELREVTLGACDAQRCAIERGVTEGETVAAGAP